MAVSQIHTPPHSQASFLFSLFIRAPFLQFSLFNYQLHKLHSQQAPPVQLTLWLYRQKMEQQVYDHIALCHFVKKKKKVVED